MNKLIVFDWGNVLINSDFGDFTIKDAMKYFAVECGIKNMDALLREDSLWLKDTLDVLPYLKEYGDIDEYKSSGILP